MDLSRLLIQVFDQVQGSLQTELAYIDQKLMGIRAAPVLIGIRLIVILPSAVCSLDCGGCFLFREMIAVHNSFDAVFHIGADEDIQTVGILTKNEISAPPYDNTGTPFGQALNDGRLC